MACYYIVISSTHLSNGHFRNIKGVFRGPLSKNGNKNLDYADKEKTIAKALEDLRANFYCELCDKQYYKHQEFDNHINSYDHAHKQRLKELKQREFARNVASKSRKDEKKQEKALKRLHELAEQRREVRCASGSGPMFRSTTVAIEDASKEAPTHVDNKTEGIEPAAAYMTHTVKDLQVVLPGQHGQTDRPFDSKVKKQIYGQKIGFSFSFQKKASVKLESSAAVFCENTEEGSTAQRFRQKNRAIPGDCNHPGTPLTERELNSEERHCNTGAQQESVINKCTAPNAQLQGLCYVPIKENNTGADTSLCSMLAYSEDPSQSFSDLPTTTKETVRDIENCSEFQDSEAREIQTKNNVHVREESKMDVTITENRYPAGNSPQPGDDGRIFLEVDSSQIIEKDTDATNKNLCIFTKPSKPFVPVLGKDGSTVLQWPSELLMFTKTEKSLSYSCNPLYFDFKSSRNKTESEKSKCNANEAHVLQAAAEEAQRNDNAYVSTYVVHGEAPYCDSESTHGLSHSPIQKNTDFTRDNLNLQELSEQSLLTFQNNDEANDRLINAADRSAKLKKHKKSRKRSRDWNSVGRKEQEKNRGCGDRYDCRSRKQRRKRKASHDDETQKEANENGNDSKDFLKQTKCTEGCVDKFGGDTAEQTQSLEESKQSNQNQEQNDSNSSKAKNIARRQPRTAGILNSTAEAATLPDENGSDYEVVLRNSVKNLYNPSTEQMNTTGHCSLYCDIPYSQNTCITDRRSVSDHKISEHFSDEKYLYQSQLLKRRHGSQNEQEVSFPKRSANCPSSGNDSCRLKRSIKWWKRESSTRSGCKPSKKRKRRRKAYIGNQGFVINWKMNNKDAFKPNLCIDLSAETSKHDNRLANAFPNQILKGGSKHPGEVVDIMNSLENANHLVHQAPTHSFLLRTQEHPIARFLDWTSNTNPDKGFLHRRFSLNESATVSTEDVPEREIHQTESWNIAEVNKTTHVHQTANLQTGKDTATSQITTHCCRCEVKQTKEHEAVNIGPSNLFQYNPSAEYHRNLDHFTVQDAKVRSQEGLRSGHLRSQEGLRSGHLIGSFSAPQGALLLAPDEIDKYKTHTHMLHQQAFSSKLKPTLSAPPLSVPSPATLHPLHMQQLMSSTSITIQPTILQHHAAALAATCSFLQPHPQLYPQAFPFSRPPLPQMTLAPGMCPENYPSFIPTSQLPMVAPTTLHPGPLTFHPLPHTTMFSPLFPSHPTVFPMQSLF
ncbi:G patch domain-containing protein 8-like [Acipenser ruthenus]|uniref:G patch domain-containing protein 8-like n=1 Tax=Acipenser ruthenus TaxID=7906 RepID=UPI00145A508B|nr:G patch domain-containing protein 8-like [Acipenser ruthenus]